MKRTFDYLLTTEDAGIAIGEKITVDYTINNGVAVMINISMLPAIIAFVKQNVLYENLQKATIAHALNKNTAALTAAY